MPTLKKTNFDLIIITLPMKCKTKPSQQEKLSNLADNAEVYAKEKISFYKILDAKEDS